MENGKFIFIALSIIILLNAGKISIPLGLILASTHLLHYAKFVKHLGCKWVKPASQIK
jgi:hypothetical protein